MKTYSVLVAIAGDLLNTVPRENVTVAEIAILQALHGKGAITRVHEQGEVEDVGHAKLVQFLRRKWPASRKLIPAIVEHYGRLPTELDELELVPAQMQGAPIHETVRETLLRPSVPDNLPGAELPAAGKLVQHAEPTNALGEDTPADDPFADASSALTG